MTPNQNAEGLSTSSERVSETAEIEHEPIGPFDRTSSAHYTEGKADADGLKPQVRDHSETLSAFTVMRDEFFPDAKPQPLAKADEVGEAVERLTAIVSDAEIIRVHGHANFGSMSPREVVNDGVWKYSIGYSGGHTQLCILLEHGLITTPRPGRYDANLTKKGKRYARALYQVEKASQASEIARLKAREAALMEGLRKAADLLDSIAASDAFCEPVPKKRESDDQVWRGERVEAFLDLAKRAASRARTLAQGDSHER